LQTLRPETTSDSRMARIAAEEAPRSSRCRILKAMYACTIVCGMLSNTNSMKRREKL